MKYLEENFLSVVLVTRNNSNTINEVIHKLIHTLEDSFRYYEIIFVDNQSTDSTLEVLKDCSEKITIIELPYYHSEQLALAAGVDIAIGDYIVEIPYIDQIENWDTIISLYKESQKGFDFVFYTSNDNGLSSRFFYFLLNKNLQMNNKNGVVTSMATLSSRRGQNKAESMGKKIVNRNVSYVLSGLDYTALNGKIKEKKHRRFFDNLNLLFDTFIFYTDVITKFMTAISVIFLVISILTGMYSLIVKNFYADIAAGWVSTVLILELGFSGVFIMFTIISKYLNHILKNTLMTKNYIYKDVIKKNSLTVDGKDLME